MNSSARLLYMLVGSSLALGCSDGGRKRLDAGTSTNDPAVVDEDAASEDEEEPDDEEEEGPSEDADAGGEDLDATSPEDDGAVDADGDVVGEDAATDDAAAGDAGTGDAGTGDAGVLDGSTADAGSDGSVLPGDLDASLPDGGDADAALDAGGGSPGDAALDAGADAGLLACDDDTGLTLPPGFCARVFATGLAGPRHIAVTPAGDVFVALKDTGAPNGSFVGLRDTNGDGRADVQSIAGSTGGNGIFWAADQLYFAQNDSVLRYALPSGTLTPESAPITLVTGLPSTPDHAAKSVVVDGEHVYVNIGSASNACQVENRVPYSPGIDPCPELATRSGVWKFYTYAEGQTLASGERMATGTRNLNALALEPLTNNLFGAQNGRDQLHENWPTLFSAADDQRLPAEGVYQVNIGDDYGWPYCYFDAERNTYLLAPEYGGDGIATGRCAELVRYPATTLPAHWAPLGMTFYTGSAFPARYQNGLFIANHGSRFAPDASGELPGYNVVFVPFSGGTPSGAYERFAEGFAGPLRPLPEAAAHRPVGVAQGPDGALYVSDDQGGTVYRILYRGAP